MEKQKKVLKELKKITLKMDIAQTCEAIADNISDDIFGELTLMHISRELHNIEDALISLRRYEAMTTEEKEAWNEETNYGEF